MKYLKMKTTADISKINEKFEIFEEIKEIGVDMGDE